MNRRGFFGALVAVIAAALGKTYEITRTSNPSHTAYSRTEWVLSDCASCLYTVDIGTGPVPQGVNLLIGGTGDHQVA